MGSSLYELDLELFEDIDSEVGNYCIVGIVGTHLFSLFSRCSVGFSTGSQVPLPFTKVNTSKFQFHLETVDEEPLRGMCHCKLLSFLF